MNPDDDMDIEHMENSAGCGFMLEVTSEGESFTDEVSAVPHIHVMLHDDHVHLSGLYVPVEMRRRGIGGILMRRTLRYLDQLELTSRPIMLDARPYGESPPSRELLIKFYEGLGFVRWPHHPTSMVLWPKEVDHG